MDRQEPSQAPEYPRFIVIRYFIPFTKNIAHFATLIVDLDHMKNNQYTLFVYVYDSVHFLCYSHGIGSYKLDKNAYFDFGLNILGDDEQLNNDINWSPHLFAINDDKTSKLQYIWKICKMVEPRCDYFCEAAANLLLSNDEFIDYYNNTPPGQKTRDFLRKIWLELFGWNNFSFAWNNSV